MTLQERIEDGLNGKFQGLSNGLSRINSYIFGIQRGCYYLIGGMSGTYKSMLTDFMVTNAIQDAEKQGIKLSVFYYSFEIDELSKKCNWLSSIIYQKHNVVIPPEKIKGLGHFRLTVEEKELVDLEVPYVDSMFSKINFRFKATNPTGIYNELWKFGKDNGQFEMEDYYDKDNLLKKKIKRYIPNDPHSYTLIVLDHLLFLSKERGFSNKEVIDKYSEYCVELRNMFGFSFLNISQFNDGLSTVERAKFKGVDLSPQQSDFKETRSPYSDADVVLGIMVPNKLDMESCLGYNVKKLGNNMLMLKVIKNRLSTDNIGIGLIVNPKAGIFKELPKPTETETMKKVYNYIEEINKN